jgi:hypothetical protein
MISAKKGSQSCGLKALKISYNYWVASKCRKKGALTDFNISSPLPPPQPFLNVDHIAIHWNTQLRGKDDNHHVNRRACRGDVGELRHHGIIFI